MSDSTDYLQDQVIILDGRLTAVETVIGFLIEAGHLEWDIRRLWNDLSPLEAKMPKDIKGWEPPNVDGGRQGRNRYLNISGWDDAFHQMGCTYAQGRD